MTQDGTGRTLRYTAWVGFLLIGVLALTPAAEASQSGQPPAIPPGTTITNFISPVNLRSVNESVAGNNVGRELQGTLAAAVGPNVAVIGNDRTGVVTAVPSPGADVSLTFFIANITQVPALRRTGLSKAAQISVSVDPNTGTAVAITPNNLAISIVPAPADLEEFIRIMRERNNVTETLLQRTGGQLLLSTTNLNLQLSMRPSFVTVTGGGGTPGLVTTPDGRQTISYTIGRQQQLFPLALDQPAVIAQLLQAFPGISANGTLEGDIVVTAGNLTRRLRPQFEVSSSPAGSRRGLALESETALTVDFTGARDGRRQRFTILP